MFTPRVAAAEGVRPEPSGPERSRSSGPAGAGVVAAWACPPEWVTAGTTR